MIFIHNNCRIKREDLMPVIAPAPAKVPVLSTEQMIEVDRLMIKSYSIELKQMMENAGRSLAIVAREQFFQAGLAGKRILTMVGTGGNGGGALVAARRLQSWGAQVSICLTANPAQLSPVTAHQRRIVHEMGIPEIDFDDLANQEHYDLLLDGIIGYRIKGDPRGNAKTLIDWANEQPSPVLALDTPSGLHLSSGQVHDPCIKASATVTLALPKQGLYAEAAQSVVGDLFLADISVPPELYQHLNVPLSDVAQLFGQSDIVRLPTVGE